MRVSGVLRTAIRRDSVGCEARCVSPLSGVVPRAPLAARRRPASWRSASASSGSRPALAEEKQNRTRQIGQRIRDLVSVARIEQALDQPLDDPGALYDLAQYDRPRLGGQTTVGTRCEGTS